MDAGLEDDPRRGRIHRGLFRAENDSDGHESFAAVERPMLNRLLGRR